MSLRIRISELCDSSIIPCFKHLNFIGGTKSTNQNETKKKGSIKLDLTSIVVTIFKIESRSDCKMYNFYSKVSDFDQN